MKTRLLSAVAVVLVVGVLEGSANAAPTPVYSVTCSPSGSVQGTWQKAKLSQIRVEWVATTGSFDPATLPVSQKPPKGSFAVNARGTGGNPTSATVTFTDVDGVADPPVTVPCQ